MARCIRRCCELKAEVVAADEREMGQRALLNLGHTFGHAIEAHMGYGNWLHGEAVSAGMVMAARTAERLGQFTAQDTDRIIRLLKRAGLPVTGPTSMKAEEYLPHMMRDKKCWAVNFVWCCHAQSDSRKCAAALHMIRFWLRLTIAGNRQFNLINRQIPVYSLYYPPFTGC